MSLLRQQTELSVNCNVIMFTVNWIVITSCLERKTNRSAEDFRQTYDHHGSDNDRQGNEMITVVRSYLLFANGLLSPNLLIVRKHNCED